MYTPHTVTVFNSDSATILRGVFLDISKAANVRESGMDNADAATLYIPFSTKAVDALTGAVKTFVTPKAYRAAADKSGMWTLDETGTFFAKGEIRETGKYQEINKKYDDVFRLTSVDTRDFGSIALQHWQCGGK